MKKKKHKYSTNIYDIKLSIYNLFCILIYLLFNKNRFAYFNDCGCRSTSVIRKRVSIKSSKFGDSKQKSEFQLYLFLHIDNYSSAGEYFKIVSDIVRVFSYFTLIVLALYGVNQLALYYSWKFLLFYVNTFLILAYIGWAVTVHLYKVFCKIVLLLSKLIQCIIYGIPFALVIEFFFFLCGYYDILYFNVLINGERNLMRVKLMAVLDVSISIIMFINSLNRILKLDQNFNKPKVSTQFVQIKKKEPFQTQSVQTKKKEAFLAQSVQTKKKQPLMHKYQ